MTDMDKSLKDILQEILKGYGFEAGPLFKLAPKLRLHSTVAYKSSLGEEKLYIKETVEKASHIFNQLNFKGDLLLVYDSIYSRNPKKEVKFLESILVNLKRKEDYN